MTRLLVLEILELKVAEDHVVELLDLTPYFSLCSRQIPQQRATVVFSQICALSSLSMCFHNQCSFQDTGPIVQIMVGSYLSSLVQGMVFAWWNSGSHRMEGRLRGWDTCWATGSSPESHSGCMAPCMKGKARWLPALFAASSEHSVPLKSDSVFMTPAVASSIW